MWLESDSFDVISKAILEVSEAKLKNGEYKSKAEQLHAVRRAELYLRIGLADVNRRYNTIRYYLERAITECRSNLELDINGIFVNIPLSKFTNVPIYGPDGISITYESQHIANEKAVANRVKLFKDAIRDNPELGGKARFFITLDDDKLGIQYFKIAPSDTLGKYFQAHGTAQSSSPVYVDVDINNDPYNYLEKLARVSMMYQQGPGNRRFGLVMKQQGADITDSAYFVLTGDGFLSKDKIFSKEGLSGGATRKYLPLIGLQFTGVFDIDKYNSRIDGHYFIYNLYLDYVKNLDWFIKKD